MFDFLSRYAAPGVLKEYPFFFFFENLVVLVSHPRVCSTIFFVLALFIVPIRTPNIGGFWGFSCKILATFLSIFPHCIFMDVVKPMFFVYIFCIPVYKIVR